MVRRNRLNEAFQVYTHNRVLYNCIADIYTKVPAVSEEQVPDESPIVTKLRAVPRGAPRIIERKGQYTIRKGVRIQDYRLPGPVPWPCVPPSSAEYMCNDGFDINEASLGYPQPMSIQSRQTPCGQAASGHEQYQLPRSPSIGTNTKLD